MPTYTVQQIADRVGGDLRGPADLKITGVDQIDTATPNQITFIRSLRHAPSWSKSTAGAVLVTSGIELDPGTGRTLIRVDDADVALTTVLSMFAPPSPRPAPGIHATAIVDPSAQVANDVAIGPGCVIGKGVRIGKGSTLHANVSVFDDTVLGPGCELFPGVVVYDRCELGSNVRIHANAVIGSDGFGYQPAPDGARLVKVPQIGTVRIGNDVEVGACSCIDRGKFSATVIGDGTKIDNLCQVAHNCRVGSHVVLAGQVGLAGSVTLGDGVAMAGQSGVVDHINVGKGAKIGAKSAVLSHVPEGAVWYGTIPAHDAKSVLREFAALRRLPKLIQSLRRRGKRSGTDRAQGPAEDRSQ